MADIEDEEEFPNDFDGLDFDNIPELQAPTIRRHAPEVTVPSLAVPRNVMLSATASPVPSATSSSVEDIDSAFLAAVDALEARALSEMSRADSKNIVSKAARDASQGGMSIPPSPSFACVQGTHSAEADGASGLNQFHEKPTQPPPFPIVDKKGKRKAEPQEDIDVRAVLAGYETELTCPICCDLLVGPQVANPCGHTCCGECGYGWLAQNEYEPTCAVCRTNLCPRVPLLPNFAVDGFVRQHLEALARSGRPEWQERGYRTIEWKKRLESWKKQADERAAKKKLREATCTRRRQPLYEAEDYAYLPPWLGIEEAGEPLVARVLPRRATRSRR